MDEKSRVTFLLCDPGCNVHKPDVQNKWDDNTHTHTLQCFCFVFVWCPCMAINVSVHHEGGFLPDYYTIGPMLLPSGNPFKCHEGVLCLQPMIPPKRFDISPPDWGMLRRSRRNGGHILSNVETIS